MKISNAHVILAILALSARPIQIMIIQTLSKIHFKLLLTHNVVDDNAKIVANILNPGKEPIFSKSSQNFSFIYLKWALFPDLRYIQILIHSQFQEKSSQ
jgi:hypothetical protein